MNIDLKLSKLLRDRNGEDIKRTLEITACEARDLEKTEKIHERELKVVKKISTPEHLKQPETDHQSEDEQEHPKELKKREKGKDRQSELEQLRAAVRALSEEEEIVELRRKIAAGRRSTMPQAQPSKKKGNSTQEDEFEDEKDWRRKEERKTNPRRSPTGPHGVLEAFTDDEDESHRRSKMRTAQRKVSSTQPHFEETDDQPTDEEKSPPPKKGPKVARKPQTPPDSHELDDLIARFQRFSTPLGSPHGSRSGSPMYYSPYGSPLPPSMAPDGYGYGYGYGYGGGVPGTFVNTGVGNITGTIISNVGNDNSVKKVYRK